ncbi:MAG: transposase [Rhodoplanes sp.]
MGAKAGLKPPERQGRALDRSFLGYKNHVNVDRTHKLIRRYAVTDAAVHDSRKLDGLLHQGNTSQDVFGDSAYRSAVNEATLKAHGLRSRIHVRAARGHPLSKAKAVANRGRRLSCSEVKNMSAASPLARPWGRWRCFISRQ